jgi:hypothetical protein
MRSRWTSGLFAAAGLVALAVAIWWIGRATWFERGDSIGRGDSA